MFFSHERGIARDPPVFVQHCLNAAAACCRKGRRRPDLQTLLLCQRRDGFGQGMLAAGFNGCRQLQKGICVQIRIHQHDVLYRRLAGCDRAGFVQHNGVHFMQRFQRLGRFHQNAVFRGFPGTDHDRHRRCQPQGTGAGNDQHADGRREGEGKVFSSHQPDNQRHQGNANDHRHKHTGDFVGEPGNGRLGAAGFIHQPDDLRQGGVVADLRGPEPEGAVGVDGRRHDGIAHGFFHRHRFSRNGCLIQRAFSLSDHAIHRNGLSRFHDDNVTCQNIRGIHFHFLTVAPECGGFRRQIHELAQGISGFGLAPGLQVLADGHQRHDGRCALEIQAVLHLVREFHVHDGQGMSHDTQIPQTIDIGCARADGHQAVHVRGPFHQGLQKKCRWKKRI